MFGVYTARNRIGPDDLQISLFDKGPPPACPELFNMAAHTLMVGQPDKTALEVISAVGEITESWSYADLQAAILGTATGLIRAGIHKGDRVLLRIGNSSDFPILFFAANAIGAIPVPTSAMLTEPELAFIINDCAPTFICLADQFPDPEGARILRQFEFKGMRNLPPAPFADTLKDDPAYMVYTSGTSGKPKGVLHAQRAAWARRMMWDGWYGLRQTDRVLHAGAFNWTYTLGAGLTDPWAIGATALIYTGPPNKGIWAELALHHHASIFAASPGVYRQLLASNADCTAGFINLRHGLSAGEKLAPKTRHDWNKATQKPIYEALGMSEVSTYISQSPDNSGARPQVGRKISILADDGKIPVATGEIGNLTVHTSDQGLMLRYWNSDNNSFDDEWFITGDRAEMDASGNIIYHGRNDDLMNAQGYRVSAHEVEEVMAAHPAITECAVIELPVRENVSIIAAYFTARENVPVNAIENHCTERLARYKCPKKFTKVNALPKSANGKLLRRALIEEHEWKPT